MGTRANIHVTDGFGGELWYYRGHDGWPEATMPTLQKLIGWVRDGTLNRLVMDTSGWLILLGIQVAARSRLIPRPQSIAEIAPETYGKCVGVIDVTTCRHSDINYLYEIDLTSGIIAAYSVRYEKPDELLFTDSPEQPWAPEKGTSLD